MSLEEKKRGEGVSMDARTRILQAFRTYCTNHPYAEVSVGELCAAADVSKKTFYKYFENKQAVLESLLYRDTVEPSESFLKSLYPEQMVDMTQASLETLFSTFYRHRDFYAAMFKSRSRSSVRKVCVQVQYRYNKELFMKNPESQPVDSVELDYACWFFASNTINSLEWWADHDFKPAVHEMAVMYNHWVHAYNRENGTFKSNPAYSMERL